MANFEDVFYKGTKAMFEACEKPEREADFVSNSGSTYWYTEGGVIRYADHWGKYISSCDWGIDGYDDDAWMYEGGAVCGFCAWDGFEVKGLDRVGYFDVAEWDGVGLASIPDGARFHGDCGWWELAK